MSQSATVLPTTTLKHKLMFKSLHGLELILQLSYNRVWVWNVCLMTFETMYHMSWEGSIWSQDKTYTILIKAQYNIDGMIRHKNDLISVLSWVTEINTLEHNPVLF